MSGRPWVLLVATMLLTVACGTTLVLGSVRRGERERPAHPNAQRSRNRPGPCPTH
ncbi:MAG TPA: hypothetical protein VFU40_01545 [Gemmatimonadales bacterium]|nr:hypothetical protein [Gemmatimonadales bacterium]